eukprot:521431_1
MAAPAKPQVKAYASGVNVVTIAAGDGKTFPKKGDLLTMHYTGRFHGGAKDGEKFDSSVDKGRPFSFNIGMGKVIKGWDQGVINMSLGQKAVLEISYDFGYGAGGYGPIPAKQDLKFEVELLKIG